MDIPTAEPTAEPTLPDISNCTVYTFQRVFGSYASEESVSVYANSTDTIPLWSYNKQSTATSVDLCLPEGIIYIVMSDRYVSLSICD